MNAPESTVTLDRYLVQRGPIPYAKAARIAVDALSAMESRVAAGDLDSVQRIHPGRLAIRGGSVLLLDLVELAGGADLDPSVWGYTSPEEFQGAAVDERSALYSLGCTLFELLTGKKPFPWVEPEEIRRGHLEAPIPDPRALNAGIPVSLANLVRSLLAKDPDLRPQSIPEVADSIRACLGIGDAGATSASRPAPAKMVPKTKAQPPGASRAPGARLTGPREAGHHRASGRRAAIASRRRAPTSAELLDDGAGEDEPPRRRLAAKQPPIITYCGIGIGAAISLILIYMAVKNSKDQPEILRETRAKLEQEARERRIAQRMQVSLPAQFRRTEEELAKILPRQLNLPHPPSTKLNAWEQIINQNPHTATPSGRQLAEQFFQLRAQVAKQSSDLRQRGSAEEKD